MVELSVREEQGAISVSIAGLDLMRYVYDDDSPVVESPRPYLHPVRTLGGRLVTVYRPHDHVWHRGISWALPYVGDLNFWGGPTYQAASGNYEWADNNGVAVTTSIDVTQSADDAVTIAQKLEWRFGDAVVLSERRRLTARLTDDPDAWALEFSTTMANESGTALAFGSPTTHGRPDAGYGGLFWRGPRSFTGGVIHAAQGSGGDELQGSRGSWAGFTGRHDETDGASTVLMVEHPGNPGAPNQWFLRSEQFAAVCAAPFFSAERTLQPGADLRYDYAVLVADGAADHDRCERLVAGVSGWTGNG